MSDQDDSATPRGSDISQGTDDCKILGNGDVTVCEWVCENCDQHYVTDATAVIEPIGADPLCPYCGSREVEIA